MKNHTINLNLYLISISAILLPLTGCNRGKADASDSVQMHPVAVQMATVQSRQVQQTILAQGTLEPRQGQSATISPPIAGRIQHIYVKDGEKVTKGELLVTMDYRTAQANAQSAAAALQTSEAETQQSSLSARAAVISQVSAIKMAKINLQAAISQGQQSTQIASTVLKSAETNLNKLKSGARPQQIAQADQSVVQAKATYQRAQHEQQRQSFLFKNGISSRVQLEDADTALTLAKSSYESAEQQDNLIRAGSRPQDIQSAELGVEQAQESLQQAQTDSALKIEQARAALNTAEAGQLGVEALQAKYKAMLASQNQKASDLTAALTTASYTQLRSPLSGVVANRKLNPGDVADGTTPILRVMSTTALDLVAHVPAENGLLVHVGMRANITTQDLPGKIFAGSVESTGQVDPLTGLMSIHILVPNSRDLLPTGIFASAQVVVNQTPKATVVPKEAVITRNGKQVVFTVGSDGSAHMTTVAVGITDGDWEQILKGVSPGDRVITLGQYELDDGAKVTQAEVTRGNE